MVAVLEAPGRQENFAGVPVVGPTGKLVKTELAEAGLSASSVYWTNAVKCWPPTDDRKSNRKPRAEELEECLPWLVMELHELRCPVVLVLGEVAKKQFQRALAEVEGYSPRVFYEWHPAAFLHKPDRARKDKWRAIIRAAARAAMGVPDEPVAVAESWSSFEEDDLVLAYLLKANTRLSFDTETTPGGIGAIDILVSWSLSDGHDSLFWEGKGPLQDVWDWAAESGHVLCGSNIIQYDYFVCAAAGLDVVGAGANLRDTMLEAHVKRESWVGLKDLARYLCHMEMEEIKNVLGIGKRRRDFDEALRSDTTRLRAISYAIRDAVAGARVHDALDAGLVDGQRDYLARIEYPLAFTLARNTQRGVLVDRDKLGEVGAELTEELRRTADWLAEIGLDPQVIHKPHDLGPALAALGVPLTVTTEKRGQLKTDETTLLKAVGVLKEDELSDLESVHVQFRDFPHVESFVGSERTDYHKALVSGLLHYRHTDKLKSTYIDNIDRLLSPAGRIHAEFRQAGSDRFGRDPTDMGPATGRISCADPNLQNIPKEGKMGKVMRDLFVPSEGMAWVRADMSQLELRLIGHFTQAAVLLDVFENDLDPHQTVADMLSVERSVARTGVYAVVYGATPAKTATTLQVSISEAERLHERFEKDIPELVTYRVVTERFLYEHGYVETLLGRRMYLPEYNSPVPRLVREALRQAWNGRIQGTGAELMKIVQVESERLAWCYGGYQLFQVHDELNFEIPFDTVEPFMVELSHLGREVGVREGLTVPLKFEPAYGRSWAEAMGFEIERSWRGFPH